MKVKECQIVISLKIEMEGVMGHFFGGVCPKGRM